MLLAPIVNVDERDARIAIETLADDRLTAARTALEAQDYAGARSACDALIAGDPDNAIVLNLRAETDLRQARYDEAATWFERCLLISPCCMAALHGLAYSRFQQVRLAQARALVDRMLALDPMNFPARLLKAAIAALAGDNADAALIYKGVLAEHRGHYPSLLGYGHSLRIIGRTSEAIDAYKEARRISPASGEPWSCLASLKTYRFGDDEVAAMQRLDRRRDMPDGERIHLSFALGRAYWERGEDAASFDHYARGNVLCRRQARFDPETTAARVEAWIERSIAAFSPPAESHPQPDGTPVPIFVVGLPRSGTTLVEQIIGAHSAVEAAGELPHLETIARRLMDPTANLDAIDRAALGAEYLEAIAIHRKTDKSFIVDKLPTNFRHIALIRAILPHARIVDVRRHPLASCVAMLRQNFLNLPEYAGTIADLARSRLRYFGAMQRFAAALPDAVVPIRYEDLVDDTETQIRRLIAGLRLPFEPACLAWYAQTRPVRTPSSEQVRQPIYRDALDEWQRFDPWLDDARAVLEAELATWNAPALA